MELPWISIKDKEPEDMQYIFTARYIVIDFVYRAGRYCSKAKMRFDDEGFASTFDYWIPCVPPKETGQ